jgi:hypothetical protein
MADPKQTLNKLISSYVTFMTLGNQPLPTKKVPKETSSREQTGETTTPPKPESAIPQTKG